MAYYVELTGGDIQAVSILNGGDAQIAAELSGGDVYPSGGGSATLQTKSVSITPTESTQTQQITPDAGFDGLSEVDLTTAAIPASYVGSGVPRKTSADLTASGATVTAPAGYYENDSSKAVASGSATTPATTITANPTLSVSASGLITANVSKTQNITPTVSPGYVNAGTAGTVNVSGAKTKQLATQAAATYHPATTDQTIAGQQYLTGAQTIKGVTTNNLLASNIKKDVVVEVGDSADPDRIVSVTGTYEGGGGGGSWTEQTIATSGSVSQALNENTIYHFTGDLTALNISFNASSATHPNYRFDFLSGVTPPTLIVPSIVTMPNSFSVKARRSYAMDVFDNVCSFNDQLTVDPYHYSTADGSLYYGKGAPPGGGGTSWKITSSNGVRSFLAIDFGDCTPFSWDSSTSSFPDYGKTLYPIPIPSDATGIRITIPNRRCGPSFWTWGGSTSYTRVLDPGWQNNVDGVVSYDFTAGIYEYLCVNIDSGTLESSVDLRFVTS